MWLATDQGRLRAATQGMDKLDAELAEAGFLRVHRRYVVNLDRVREVERGCKGEMSAGHGRPGERTMVPVSRRNAADRAPRAGHLSHGGHRVYVPYDLVLEERTPEAAAGIPHPTEGARQPRLVAAPART